MAKDLATVLHSCSSLNTMIAMFTGLFSTRPHPCFLTFRKGVNCIGHSCIVPLPYAVLEHIYLPLPPT